jgi:two-component system OmpR family response regulator
MRSLVTGAGLADSIAMDSAGTGGWHVGDPPDRRSAAEARRRGIPLERAPDAGPRTVRTRRFRPRTRDSQVIPRSRPASPQARVDDGGVDATRVLVVDDEEGIVQLVATALRYEGFDVDTASTGRGALDRIAAFAPEMVVLDVMLPDLDGFEVVRRLSADGQRVPVLFLTARNDADDRVRGLTLGADDYLGKPFSVAELVARVHAILRRTKIDDEPTRLTFADLILDTGTYEALRGDERIELTPTEYRLLQYLMLNARRVVSKSQILDHVWNYDFDGDASVVETYISYLRKKIDRFEPPLIHTVRGFGYSLRLPRDH